MKKIIFVLWIVMGLSATVFSQTEGNQFDADGKRHGPWKVTFDGSTQLRYEGTFEHGKEVGIFKFYCEACKDQPMAIKKFTGKDSISEVQYFTVKGKLVSEGKMNGKLRWGEWLYYHEKSQNLMMQENYKNGILDGKKITYFPNGKITEETQFSNGMKHGKNYYYSPDGILLKKLHYQNDQLQGPALYYDAYGKVVIEGSYKNGKKHGLWKYYKNGNIILEEIYPKVQKQ